MSVTRSAQNVITKEIVDDRIVGSTLPYACSGEVDHFQHCVLCCCSGLLWIPCWIVACIVPGFCPTPCGENCSCEAKRFIDPIKRLMWRLGKVNQVFTVEISPRPQLVAGLVDPSPEILRAPVSGVPCVMFHVVAYEYVDARSPGAIDFDSVDVDGSVVLKGEGFDNNGTFAEPQRGVCEGLCCDNMIWVKRFEEVKTADFYLSDPNYTSATHPNGPQLFVPARGPNGPGSDGSMLALDFLPNRADRTRRGVLSIYFTGRELVIPHNITDLGARHGFKHSRTRRRVMRYEERTYCVGDPVAIMGVVGKGIDPFGKPVPCISPMLEQELPEAYYQLLKMTESERQTLLSVQGKMIITGDMQSLEPPFIGCACFSEWEPCGGCTPAGCSKMC